LTGTLRKEADADRATAQERLAVNRWILAGALLAAVAAAAVLARRAHRQLVGPLQTLERKVKRRTAGEQALRVPVIGPPEIRTLAHALNESADASDRLHAQQQRVTDELRAVDQTRRNLLSTVSHELRTPLTNIAGYLELLADDDLSPHQAHAVDVISRNNARLRSLVDDLLTLSAVE